MDNLKLARSARALIANNFVGVIGFGLLVVVLGCPAYAQQHKGKALTPENLPTGMSITPTAARGSTFQALSPDLPGLPRFTVDHPVSTALSPDGNTLLILTSGYNRNNDVKGKAIPDQTSEYVFVFDVRGKVPVKKQVLRVPNAFIGLAWNPDGKQFYVSGGQDDSVHVFAQEGGRWREVSPLLALGHKTGLGLPDRSEGKPTPVHPMVAGLSVSPNGKLLLAANYQNDSVSLLDLDARKLVTEVDLRPGKINPAQKGVAGGEYPFGVAFAGNGKAYVSSLRDREIVVLDLQSSPSVTGRIKTRGQPGKLITNRDGTLLFAAADNSDSVVVVQTATDHIIAEIKTTAPASLFPNRAGFKGSNPNSLALAPDEKTLYVTNGGTNSVAVIALNKDKDLDDSRVAGLIPTGWYPNSVSVSRDGTTLYVVNGKSNPGPDPKACRKTFTTVSDDRPCAAAGQYVLQLEKGGFSVVPRPDAAELQELTQQVARNNHFLDPIADGKSQQLFAFLRQRIKHVIYIVKENRTYDQVLGDLEKGNGDPSLVLFPEALTPNHHDLARRFVTLDNFYDSGEVSGVGWNWSTAARTTDVVERTIPLNYAFRGMTYDVEGMNRGINVGAESPRDRNTENMDDAQDQLPGSADVAAPDGPEDETGAGYLWDAALRAGRTVRNYGFFVDLSHYAPEAGPSIPPLHDPAASATRVAVPAKAPLQAVTDPYFRGFDQRFPDYWRYKEWEREFDEFAAHDNLPALELVRLPHDHFGNFSEAHDGVNTVETMMADNDYAVGLLVEKIAHSKYAGNTLIFVIEDDAQNGPDHVDAHRSIALVAGPYVKQRALISTRFNTVTLLRTMEEVLGIGPLGLNDAVQLPMAEVFSTQQESWTYTARVPAVLRTTQLPLPATGAEEKSDITPIGAPRHDAAYWSGKTQGFDFSAEDKLDSSSFNLVLWNGLKDEGQPYPSERDGRDLRKNRHALLRDFNKSKSR